jgi:Ca-activated chloride channel family protein
MSMHPGDRTSRLSAALLVKSIQMSINVIRHTRTAALFSLAAITHAQSPSIDPTPAAQIATIPAIEQQSTPSYGLRVSVDEVLLTFHAADVLGLPINDLKLDELNLSDNGKPPRKILSFQALQNLPINAGILLDTSESMDQNLANNRTIAAKYAHLLLRQSTDQAFVMKFGPLSEIEQPWTNDTNALATGVRKLTASGTSNIRGTALFDAIYRACLNQFGHVDHAGSGNFILLFSDGEDNTGHGSLQEAINICQRNNTAIYAFRTDSKTNFGAEGPRILADLASQSGGRVFNANNSDAEIDDDLRIIEADIRNQYRLVYKPAELKPNGSFHRIELKAPERVNSITIRSGYYAPIR